MGAVRTAPELRVDLTAPPGHQRPRPGFQPNRPNSAHAREQTASDPNKARARLSHGCRWHGHDRPGHDHDRALACAPASAPGSAPAPAAELRARPRASAPARPPPPTRWLGCWPAGTDPSAHENRNGDGEGAPRARQLRCAARPGLNVVVGRNGPPLLASRLTIFLATTAVPQARPKYLTSDASQMQID